MEERREINLAPNNAKLVIPKERQLKFGEPRAIELRNMIAREVEALIPNKVDATLLVAFLQSSTIFWVVDGTEENEIREEIKRLTRQDPYGGSLGEDKISLLADRITAATIKCRTTELEPQKQKKGNSKPLTK